VATLQAAYLLRAFKTRVLQEPASLARRLVQAKLVEEKCRLTLVEMIRDDLCAMRDELAELPLKATAPDFVVETVDLRPQVETDGDTNPSEEIRAERAKWRRRKMRASSTQRRIKERGSRDEPTFASSDVAMHPRHLLG
jgi:hypothetical protein